MHKYKSMTTHIVGHSLEKTAISRDIVMIAFFISRSFIPVRPLCMRITCKKEVIHFDVENVCSHGLSMQIKRSLQRITV